MTSVPFFSDPLDDLINEVLANDLWLSDSSKDSTKDTFNQDFNQDCEFLLSTVFNPAAALHSNPSSSFQTNLQTPSAVGISECGSFSCAMAQRHFSSLFETPGMNAPASLPPAHPVSRRGQIALSSVKGVMKTVNRPTETRVQETFAPFGIVKVAGKNGGRTLMDLNNSIQEMAKRMGMC